MSKFINNSYGFLGLTLTNLGLFIASGILLLAVCSLVFSTTWQRTEELHAIARDVSTRIQDIDARFYESSFLYQCPSRNYPYTVQVSTEYITVSAKSSWGYILCVKERFVVHPWPRNSTLNWTTGYELHGYLNKTFGHWGTQQDPLPFMNLSELENDWEGCMTSLALHPLVVGSNTPLCMEKVSIFDDTGEKHDVILMYQSP